jgi:hypothetical protein
MRIAAALTIAQLSLTCVFGQIPNSGQTLVNGKPVTDRQAAEFMQVYHTALIPGNYWYDAMSGFWGYWGHEPAGVINQGHAFAPLPANASGGHTGVFINGREINAAERLFYQNLYNTPVQPARLWLDGRSGYFGLEGNPQPVGNLALALQAKKQQQSSGCRSYTSRDAGSRTETTAYLGCD